MKKEKLYVMMIIIMKNSITKIMKIINIINKIQKT